jgi:hypothetical protein
MVAMRTYEIIVDRKVQHRFEVSARTGTEAVAHVGAILSDPDVDLGEHAAETTVVDQRIRQPRVVTVDDPTLDLEIP